MQAGSAKVDITPPKGVPMGGYLARTQPADGIHDPLFARALVLDDGRLRVAVVCCDLLALDPSTARDVRSRIEQETGIPASHTMLACSHTHAGPLVAERRTGEVDLSYLEGLEDKIVGTVREAARALRPVRLGTGRAKVYLGTNRRERTDDGTVILGKNPSGCASPYSHVLVVGAEGGGPLAILFTYGAHPGVLGPDNLKISGDYAAVAERTVEENFGGGAVALFALGFAGDVDANHDKRTFAEVETAGDALGRAVLEELKTIELTGGHTLKAKSLVVPLPLQPPPTVREAERLLYEERDRLSRILGRGQDEADINERRLMVQWASDLVRLAIERPPAPAKNLEIQVLAIGDAALVGLSAEVFADYTEVLNEASPFKPTFPISNANGDIGYVPTAAALQEGGYEVETAPRLLGALPFAPDVETVVRRALVSLLAEMAPAAAPQAEV